MHCPICPLTVTCTNHWWTTGHHGVMIDGDVSFMRNHHKFSRCCVRISINNYFPRNGLSYLTENSVFPGMVLSCQLCAENAEKKWRVLFGESPLSFPCVFAFQQKVVVPFQGFTYVFFDCPRSSVPSECITCGVRQSGLTPAINGN